MSSGERGCGIVTGVATEHKVMTNFPAAAGADSNRIVNFPGNPKSIHELFPILAPVLEHAVATLERDGSAVGH